MELAFLTRSVEASRPMACLSSAHKVPSLQRLARITALWIKLTRRHARQLAKVALANVALSIKRHID